MTKQEKGHIRGPRGQAFADKIRGLNPEQILCVSRDISQYFHWVMMHNGLGEMVRKSFEIDLFKSGSEPLCQAIDTTIEQTQAQLVLVGMEPTGHYFENLARYLVGRGQPVTLINRYAVSQNREQHMMHRQKSDPIDAAAIGDLLRRGEGTAYRPPSGVYLELQHLDRARLTKIKMRTRLKNQIIGHLDRIFPGLVLIGQAAKTRYTPLFSTDFWDCVTRQHLIRVCPNPRQLAAMTPPELIAGFHAQTFKMGPKTAPKIIAYAQTVLPPDPDLIAIRTDLLQFDLYLLETIETQMAILDERLIALVAQTPYQRWNQLSGLSLIQVARLAAAIGDPDHYDHAKQVFRRSGLVSGSHDSGIHQKRGKGSPILKTGDVHLRRALMDMINTFMLHQPVLFKYYAYLKLAKPDRVARVATARKATGILWATLRDQHSTSLLYKDEVPS